MKVKFLPYKFLQFVCFIAFSIFMYQSIAHDTPEETAENLFKITPTLYSAGVYKEMYSMVQNPTNNLRREAGSPFFAKGIPLYIEGHVYDISNIPIEDVTIEIVQANHYGVYNFMIDEDSALHDPYFLSFGRSVTNNVGEYSFLTIIPGFYERRAPHIHLLIKHSKFEFETEMFFQNHPRNKKDPKFTKLNHHQRNAVTAKVYYVDSRNLQMGMRAIFDIYINYSFT
ncbi:MAG: protocatechuate 3,4-dioxygenase beta subunit [Candidatus Deianiraeaceae bacterium]|jgi:protocatechuate 3,4-dioxygenase beta subunit